MVKSEIISELSNIIKKKIKKSDIEKTLNVLLSEIISQIKNNKATEIRKFGRLYQKKIVGKANARNPKTGEQISTKEKISIAFKMSKELKNRINLNYKG